MPNPILSSLVLPVKDELTGVVTDIEYDLSSGGSSITVDDVLSTTSENPVQNKVITNALNGKADGYIELTATAAANATSVSFTNEAIVDNKSYDVYCTTFTNITGMTKSGTTLTVTFKAVSAARTFKLRIS